MAAAENRTRKLRPEVWDFARALCAVWHVYFEDEISSGPLANSISLFLENLSRLDQLRGMPLDVFTFATSYQAMTNASALGIAAHVALNRPDKNEAEMRQSFEAYDRAREPWLWGNEPPPNLWLVQTRCDALDAAAFVLAPGKPEFVVSRFYGALIIQAWTMFESMTEDVWVDAVNARPTILAMLSGTPRGKFREKTSSGEKPTRGVSIKALQRHHFNV